jgi:hypothetical protein
MNMACAGIIWLIMSTCCIPMIARVGLDVIGKAVNAAISSNQQWRISPVAFGM